MLQLARANNFRLVTLPYFVQNKLVIDLTLQMDETETPRLLLWRRFVIAMVRTFDYWRLLISCEDDASNA